MLKKFLLSFGVLLSVSMTPADVSMASVQSKKAVGGKPITKHDPALECIAQNIYHEARGESLAGQLSVGLVVLNRVKDKRFPNTVCEVVYQKTKLKTTKTPVCQFSWVCDPLKTTTDMAWQRSMKVAQTVYRMYANGFDITNGATHFHAEYVKPTWSTSREMVQVAQIDAHVFYKWRRG